MHIAKILPFLEVAHLDRLFDYRIPAHTTVVVGQLVRVRFSGRLVNGLVYDITDTSDYQGKLAYVERVISPVIMADASMRQLVEKIAHRYIGTRPEVLRLVLPHRHVGAEQIFFQTYPEALCLGELGINSENKPSDDLDSSYFQPQIISKNPDNLYDTPVIASVVDAVKAWSRQSPNGENISLARSRLMWLLHPEQDWKTKILLVVHTVLTTDNSVIILVPTHRHGTQLQLFLSQFYSDPLCVFMGENAQRKKQYYNWLLVRYSIARIIIGMRSAIYAPAQNVDAIIMFDEGNELYSEQLVPYPHARVLATIRSLIDKSALIMMGYSRSPEAQALYEYNWASSYSTPLHEISSRVQVKALPEKYNEDPMLFYQRIPSEAFHLVQQTLQDKAPVLVHVQHKGFSAALICNDCGSVVRCNVCGGPLEQRSDHEFSCKWCNATSTEIKCLNCGSSSIRYTKPGAKRTAKELGAAFAPHKVVFSADDAIKRSITRNPCVVIATAGAEPEVDGGYGAVIFLDIYDALMRNDLRAEENVYRSIMNAMSLLSPQGKMLLSGTMDIPVVQSAVRRKSQTFAEQELAKRQDALFPPAVRLVSIDGNGQSILYFLSLLELPDKVQLLGPVSLPPHVHSLNEKTFGAREDAQRLIMRIPLSLAQQISTQLQHARKRYSMQSQHAPVRIMVDPMKIG